MKEINDAVDKWIKQTVYFEGDKEELKQTLSKIIKDKYVKKEKVLEVLQKTLMKDSWGHIIVSCEWDGLKKKLGLLQTSQADSPQENLTSYQDSKFSKQPADTQSPETKPEASEDGNDGNVGAIQRETVVKRDKTQDTNNQKGCGKVIRCLDDDIGEYLNLICGDGCLCPDCQKKQNTDCGGKK